MNYRWVWEVIFQKRVRLFHRVSKHERHLKPRGRRPSCFIRWVHISLVSRPQVYFNLTSDMNMSNFNFSSLLCSRGNASRSKEPKYTSKSSSTHPYQRTYALSKQFQEIECQSNALFDEISEHARLVRHAYHFRTTCLLDAWLSRTWKCSSQRKFSAGFAKKLRNQFCGHARSQALLRLRCVFCWFIWLKNINIHRRWFLRLIRNSSSTTRKW